MTGFCGWVGQGIRDPSTAITEMAERLGSESSVAYSRSATAVSTDDKTASYGQDGRFLCVVDGYPRWSDPALAQEARTSGPAVALLAAYRRGIFPWPLDDAPGAPTAWWCPDPRAVIEWEDFHVSRSLRRTLNSDAFDVTFDRDFAGFDADLGPRGL